MKISRFFKIWVLSLAILWAGCIYTGDAQAVISAPTNPLVLGDIKLMPGGIAGHITLKDINANTASRFYVMPNGSPTGTTSALKIFATDYEADSVNYQDFGIYFDTTAGEFRINQKANGSLGNIPVAFTFQDGATRALTISLNSTKVEGALIIKRVLGTAGDTAPNVQNISFLQPPSNTAYTITNFTNGVDGQELIILCSDANATIQNNANIALAGAVNYTCPSSGSTIGLIHGATKWFEIRRSNN